MLLGYSFEPRPNSRVLSTAGSVMTIVLSINGCSHSKKKEKQFHEKKQACLVQKVWDAATFKRFDVIQAEPPFLLLRFSLHGDSRSGFSSTIPGPIEIWKNLDKNLINKFHTSLPFIFMTGVQPPGPHPKSPI